MCVISICCSSQSSSVRLKGYLCIFFFNDTATTEIYTLSLHDALPICASAAPGRGQVGPASPWRGRSSRWERSEEHTSELQSQSNLVCRLLLEKKNTSSYASRQPWVSPRIRRVFLSFAPTQPKITRKVY